MSSALFSLPELFCAYKTWVSSHPQLASDLETTVRWLSYFIAGKINNSVAVSELIYSLSNLLILFNDRIISKSRKLELPSSGDDLKLWLTVLEYSEVFLEVSARKLWGETGKWAMIVVLQVFKCVSRLVLLLQHKEPVIESPPIAVLKRRLLDTEQRNQVGECAAVEADDPARLESVSFVLKHSGRVVRKVEASPPANLRSWKPLSRREEAVPQAAAVQRALAAEVIYVLKPVAHLGAVLCFGRDTWRPWLLALALDLASLQAHREAGRVLPRRQQLQLSRRTVGLLLYLLRSPCYERHSRDRLLGLLAAAGRNVPLASLLTGPLTRYLPHWQRLYFYLWST